MRFNMAVLVACTAILGCGGDRGSGPPQIKYGHAQCVSCGMIVSSERYASAIVLPEGEPERDLVFDDINCMLEYEASRAVPAKSQRYVHDVESLRWISADEAAFVHNPEVHTPMGSGLQAFFKSSSSAAGMSYEQIRSAAGRKAGSEAER